MDFDVDCENQIHYQTLLVGGSSYRLNFIERQFDFSHLIASRPAQQISEFRHSLSKSEI